MRPQFPGMDPWLEHPDLWPDVHNSLITAIRDELSGTSARPSALLSWVWKHERRYLPAWTSTGSINRTSWFHSAVEPVRSQPSRTGERSRGRLIARG